MISVERDVNSGEFRITCRDAGISVSYDGPTAIRRLGWLLPPLLPVLLLLYLPFVPWPVTSLLRSWLGRDQSGPEMTVS